MTLWYSLRALLRSTPDTPLDWPPPQVPELADDEDASQRLSPVASPVHILAGSALVRVRDRTLVVEKPDAPAFERPIELVSSLHIHGWAGVTSPTIAALLGQGTPVVWRGATGFPIGWSMPLHTAGLDSRRAQYAAVGTQRALELARAFVTAKIVNMKGVARRKATLRGREKLERLNHDARVAREARSLAQLLGIEGAASARYFAAWPDLISDRAHNFEWTGRTRRPPRDIINALLSYLYALLAGECLCAVVAAGLDPRLGLLHQARAGRPALALDLMEPFRPLIADQAVLTGINTGQVQPTMFDESDEGQRFTDDGRRLAIELYEKRMSATITVEGRSEPMSYRACIEQDARNLSTALREASPFYATERP